MVKRRAVLGALSGATLAACSSSTPEGAQGGDGTPNPQQSFKWKMVTTWPPNFPGLGVGASNVAKRIGEMSDGRLDIKVFAGGELVPPFEVFDAVSRGSAECGHGAAYYWRGKAEASQFFTSIPFGLNVLEMDGWLYYGGGLELWREVYAPFKLIPFPAGNTGVQMGGWFNKEINSIDDIKGLKMRIPGLGGEIFKRAGGTPVSLPGGEIYTALETGSVDASEWVGPYNDVAFGLQDAAKYYYYPGWHEPGPTLEFIVNADAWATLPEDLKAIVKAACQSVNNDMMAEFSARNASSLAKLQAEGKTEIRPFPDDVLAELKALTNEALDELAERDNMSKRILESYRAYQATSNAWMQMSEVAYLATRKL